MIAFLFCLRWLVLILLLIGAVAMVQRTCPLAPCFAPIVTLCGIAVLVYLGGILGILRPVTYGILFACALCFVVLARRAVRQLPRWYTRARWLNFPIIAPLFLLGALCLAGILCRASLVHYDNFTHWALVVKEMLITHAFPTADSVLIEFTNYPTGTACWIYFVCTVVGTGENCMILAQALLIFTALYAVFGIIEERGRFLLIAALGTGLSLLSLFNFAVRINTLLVDFVLPVLTLAAIALIYRHRRDPQTLLPALVPVLGLLVIVKSTGILFAGVALLYLLYVLAAYHASYGRAQGRAFCLALWAKASLAVFCCVLPLLLWNLRIHTVFAGVSNKFETDLNQINTAFGGKTQQEALQICSLFFETITDLSQRATLGVLLFQLLAMLGCAIGCCVLKKKWALPKVLLAMDAVLIAYLAGILAMYVFSMPMDEAAYLAGFERYAASIVVLFGGVLSICLVVDIEASFYYRLGEVDAIRAFQSVESKALYCRSALACVVAIIWLFTSEYNGMREQLQQEQSALPSTMQQVVGDHWSSEVDDARYLIFVSDTDAQVTSYYTHYIARYYLRANQVDAICLFYEDNFLNLLSQYDYLVIAESSAQARQLMQTYFGVSGEVGIYELNINL